MSSPPAPPRWRRSSNEPAQGCVGRRTRSPAGAGRGLRRRLESLAVFHRHDIGELRAEIGELSTSLTALEELQAWVEERLAAAQEERSAA
jgi:hypothetical protein